VVLAVLLPQMAQMVQIQHFQQLRLLVVVLVGLMVWGLETRGGLAAVVLAVQVALELHHKVLLVDLGLMTFPITVAAVAVVQVQ
jgi:hypothetical protein